MEQTFYVNSLFGNNRDRIHSKLNATMSKFRFQVHPFRTCKMLNGTQSPSRVNQTPIQIQNEIVEHVRVMKEIHSSSFLDKSDPFKDVIFVNYTTRELTPALKYQRIHYYLSDFITSSNIEILTLTAPIFINFMNRTGQHVLPTPINHYFLNYSILTFHDGDTDRQISNAATLDMGEAGDDDLSYLLYTRLSSNHNETRRNRGGQSVAGGGSNGKDDVEFILPYHPFRYSLFTSIQNTKNNINTILLNNNSNQLLYYPFQQDEWLLILRTIMYEHIILNFLFTSQMYKHVKIHVAKEVPYRNNVSYNFRHFSGVQKKIKTQVLNEVVFNYKDSFKVLSNTYETWFQAITLITNAPQFATDKLCLRTNNGIFI